MASKSRQPSSSAAPSNAMPTTPLRRISRGSLNALSYSASKQLAASGGTPLSFLSNAMSDLAEEVSQLQSQLESLENVQESLESFNENFAMYIYGLKMNAYCIEWSEAPLDDNFERAQKRIAQQAEQFAAQQHLNLTSNGGGMGGVYPGMGMDDMSLYTSSAGAAAAAGYGGTSAADQTYVTADDESIYANPVAPLTASSRANHPTRSSTGTTTSKGTSASGTGSKTGLKSALKKPSSASQPSQSASTGAKPKLTLAQKKKREAYTDEIIETLPLEYRGGGGSSDPKQNAIARHVVLSLIAAGRKGVRIQEIVKNPEMSQAKINKTLIALVAAKHVSKASNNGIVYSLDPSRHPTLP